MSGKFLVWLSASLVVGALSAPTLAADIDLRLGGRGAEAVPVVQTNQNVEGAILVNVNMARVLRIDAAAATIILGNPGIADVTIQDPKTLILTGKSYGQTNMIVLDAAGEPVADTLIEVVETHDDIVTVYMGDRRTTLVCEPVCQPTVMLGDDLSFTSNSIASSQLVENNAQ